MRILITGGTKGIGLTTARLLSSQHEVIALGRDTKDVDLACEKIDFDLKNIDEIESLMQRVGEIDVLINNAGIMHAIPFDTYSTEQKQEIIAVNLEAPVELMRQFADGLKKRQGRIINVASIAGEVGHSDIWYGITKAGLMNATKSFAKILGPEASVNAVAPGPVSTDMLATIPPERVKSMKQMAATGRVAEVDEVAELIRWLAIDAPKQITGSIIDINGGAYVR